MVILIECNIPLKDSKGKNKTKSILYGEINMLKEYSAPSNSSELRRRMTQLSNPIQNVNRRLFGSDSDSDSDIDSGSNSGSNSDSDDSLTERFNRLNMPDTD